MFQTSCVFHGDVTVARLWLGMIRFSAVVLLLIAGPRIDAQPTEASQPQEFLRAEFTPAASVKLALGLLYDQATVAVPEWGSGRAGMARRAEWLAAGWMARASAEYAVASYRSVDTNYRPCTCSGFPRRAAHALRGGFLEYRADDKPVIAIARFSGLATGALVTLPMLPPGYGFRDAAQRAAMAFLVDEGFNVLQEFRPEIVRTVLLRGKHNRSSRF
jgi:hypothetical protein